MKILISVYCIKEIGGISTAVTNLLREIHDKYDVSLCVPSNYISPRYEIPSNVSIVPGSNVLRDATVSVKYLKGEGVCQNVRRVIIRTIKRLLPRYVLVNLALDHIRIKGEYDVAIAFADEGFDKKYKVGGEDFRIILNNVRAKRKIAWIHNDPKKLGWTPELCEQELSGFDAIVNVSQECKDIFDDIMPSFKNKSWLVYNMYDIERIKRLSFKKDSIYNSSKLNFVTVARINFNQKKMDRIVDTCDRLVREGYHEFVWNIVGEGPDRTALQQQIDENNLNDYIIIHGHQTNPYPYIKQADAFVLTSLYEGLPMTIREAEIIGTPILTTNFGSAHEAVIDNSQGLICENSSDGVYKMIKSVLDKPEVLLKFRDFLTNNPVSNKTALSQFEAVCTNKGK